MIKACVGAKDPSAIYFLGIQYHFGRLWDLKRMYREPLNCGQKQRGWDMYELTKALALFCIWKVTL